MSNISVGAVGAAIIAGLVSLLGLVIGKEQKVSEFRQAWIDELRKSLIAYLVSINAISDNLRLQKVGSLSDNSTLLSSYKALNEASHGIVLRVNANEGPAERLLLSMKEFEALAGADASLTPDRIRALEIGFIEAAKDLLKFEWRRVKRGEPIFVWTKIVVSTVVAVMLLFFLYLSLARKEVAKSESKTNQVFHLIKLPARF